MYSSLCSSLFDDVVIAFSLESFLNNNVNWMCLVGFHDIFFQTCQQKPLISLLKTHCFFFLFSRFNNMNRISNVSAESLNFSFKKLIASFSL